MQNSRLRAMNSSCNGVFRRALPASIEFSAENEELHVLAVDDSLVDRKVIERLLKISSCKVTVVESGIRALQYLGLMDGERSSTVRLEVNLVITDYSMPGMTGYELMKKIKESSAIPVVIMSSENILTRIDRCLEEGAKDYIVKPVKLSDVRRLKDSMIKGSFETEVSTKRPTSILSSSPITKPQLVSSPSIKPASVLLASQTSSKEYKCESPRRVVRFRRYDQRS